MYAWLLPELTWLASTSRMPVAGAVSWLPLPSWLHDPGPILELVAESAAQLHAATAVDVALGFTALYLLYLCAVRLARGPVTSLGLAVVLGVGILAQMVAVLAPYALSGDVFSYAIYGRMYALHGGSPYLETPAQYAGDPFYAYVFWKFVPSFYGPLWTLISGAVALIAGDDIGLSVLLFRLIEALSALLAAVVVLAVLWRADPERALVGATLIAWSPLVIVESGLGAHNDVLMAALIVVGLALAWTGRPLLSVLAVGAIVLAGLVKLTALAVLPLLGVFLLRTAPSWRARIGVSIGSALVAAGLTAAIVWPVWAGPATFAVGTLGSGADRYVNSLAETALGEVRLRLGATRDDLEVPLQFGGWWVGVHTETQLFGSRSSDVALAELPVWAELLVVGPEKEQRLRVFDPVSGLVGFVPSWTLGPIDPPARWMADPEIAARMLGPVGAPDLIEANRLIRLVGWGAFGLAFVLALLLGTGRPSRLVAAWVGLCIVLVYVTLTWLWPWYVLWGLLPAALVPRARLTRLTLYLGWGVLMAYALMGFQDSRFWYLHNYRALPMFGLPLVLFVLDEFLRGVAWATSRTARRIRAAGRSSTGQPGPVESVTGAEA